MKFCFLVNDAPFLSEFFGKISSCMFEENHEVIVVVNNKIAEYTKQQHFPTRARFISKVDWCVSHYDPEKRDFGTLSWREFFPDFGRFTRLSWTYKRSVAAVSQLYQFFDFVFETEKPDVLIGEPPAGLFGEIGYYFAKKHNVPFLGFTDSRINIGLYDSESTDSRYEKTFKELADQDIKEDERSFLISRLKKFISHAEQPEYMKYARISFNQFALVWHYLRKLSELGPLFRYLARRKKFQAYDYESEVILRRSMAAPFELEVKQLRLLFQKRFFSQPGKEEQFFLYPLHLEPEAATLVLAMPYADQLATIKNIAFALPFPFKLYVKEHPTAMGSRPDRFYQTLKKLPNVVLIASDQDVPQLLQKSSGVITLTGTMGMEAVLAGKPAYVLGDVFYTYHPLCRKVQNFKDLRERIRLDLSQKPDTRDLARVNLRFLASYVRYTIEGSIAFAGQTPDKNDYEKMYNAIKLKIGNV